MKWFYNLKVGGKLLTAFALMALVAVIIGFVGITGIRTIDELDTQLYEGDTVPIMLIEDAKSAYQDIRVNVRELILSNDINAKNRSASAIKELDKEMEEYLAEYEKRIQTDEERRAFNKLMSAHEKFDLVNEQVMSLALAGEDEQANAVMHSEGPAAAAKELVESIETLVLINEGQARIKSDDNQATADTAAKTMIIVLCIGVALAIGLGIFMARVIGRPVNKLAKAADKLARGDLNVDVEADTKDEIGVLAQSFNIMIGKLSALTADTDMMVAAATEGKLDVRADAGRHEGEYRKIVDGINKTLDAVIGPLNVAAEYVDRISKGDIPPQITDTYYGDFNEIKNNLNGCIGMVNGLQKEVGTLIKAVREGRLEVRGDTSAFAGIWGELVGGMNALIETVAEPVNELDAVLHRMAVSDFSLQMVKEYTGAWEDLKNAANEVQTRFLDIVNVANNISKGNLEDLDALKKVGRRSDKDELNPAFVRMMEEIQNLIKDGEKMAAAALEGRLDVRADVGRHEGEFRKVIDGFNKTLDTVIGPLNVAAEYIDRISKGDIPPQITDTYYGDFNEIKNNLNGCINIMNGLQQEIAHLIVAAKEGRLETRGNAEAFTGDWGKLVGGMNGLIEAVAEPVNGLIRVLKLIAVNDLSEKIDKDYKGIWNELKNATNDVIERQTNIFDTAIKISKGDLSNLEMFKEIGRRSENDELVPSFIRMQEAIKRLVDDVNNLAADAVDGRLHSRIDATGHEGGYRKVIEGVNGTLDTILPPIKEAVLCLQEMAEGNLDVRVTGDYLGDHAMIKDALNTTLEAMNNIFKKELIRCLQEVSEGNVHARINGEYKGDFAVIKDAFNFATNQFGEILNQVAVAIEQVNNGALQVSDSSQALSQGAAESASSMDQVTASMQEINAQINQSAENATQANQIAMQSRAVAEKGNNQMDQMVRAMKDINESASNISKIIKAIDEIAFQTNLLALNAAVEAARAGKHGKGFTVVAEEVRNLAQRSAEAAKETAELIENSIKKTEVGTRITEETSEVLGEIVTGATKVTDLVSEIASASKEQALGIGQVNQGLEQVDQVIQQNSAGAEELAAASEEMSGQSMMVKQMLGKFELKQDSTNVQAANIHPNIISQATRDGLKKPVQQHPGSNWDKDTMHEPMTEAAATLPNGDKVRPEDIISLDDGGYGKF